MAFTLRYVMNAIRNSMSAIYESTKWRILVAHFQFRIALMTYERERHDFQLDWKIDLTPLWKQPRQYYVKAPHSRLSVSAHR